MPLPHLMKQRMIEYRIATTKQRMDDEARRYDASKNPQNREMYIRKLDHLAGVLLRAEKELVDIPEGDVN